ncbi:MAG: hypothetical protein KA436_08530, partial [Oligoflexales bacterium]|nr:hypothetical protein [Oligoflexales bacterium]
MKFKKPQLSFWLFWFAVLSAFLFFLQACKQISKKEKYKADVALAGSSASGESLDLGPAGSQAPVLKIQYENFKASE